MQKYDASKDYYGELGIDPSATGEQIDRAYRSQARKRHPDSGGSEEGMKRLNEARDILSDPETRNAYDAERSPPKERVYGSSMAFDPEAASRAGTLNIPVADEEYGGLLMGAATCFGVGLPLLLLVEMQWVFFLWPLRVIAFGALGFGVLMAHSALTVRHSRLKKARPDYPRSRVLLTEFAFFITVLGFLGLLIFALYAR